MAKNRSLAKAIHDTGWGEIVRQLEYKARWYGRAFVQIDKFYPSSKWCSQCGHVREKLELESGSGCVPNAARITTGM